MKTATTPETTLLRFAEFVAHHSSGNLHTWHPEIVTGARRAVKEAGGELRAIGRYRAGESEPMDNEEYSKHKTQRKIERVLEALKRGPVRFSHDDIYDVNNKRVTGTYGEFIWCRTALEKKGHKITQYGQTPNASWSLHDPPFPPPHH